MIQNFALVTLSFCTMFLAAPVWAQDTGSDDAQSVDEIIARGTMQTDPAMSAWHAGDYATAEIEFDKRLGLMEYQDGNLKEAQKQLKKLKKLKPKYREGEVSKEINAQISYLTKLVG